MANFTKRAIRDSFVKLLNKKPLHQISVRDIVEDCGVNRNTFYYYYHNIPQLVEEVVNDEIDRIIREHPAIDSVDEGVNALIGFAMENRRAVLHIYQSVNRDILEAPLESLRPCGDSAGGTKAGGKKGFREKSTDVSGLCHVRLLWRYDGMAEQWDEKRYSGVFQLAVWNQTGNVGRNDSKV